MSGVADRIRLDGRVALVTGGAGHLGRALAAAFADLGATVALADREPAVTAAAAAAVDHCSPFIVDFSVDGSAAELPRPGPPRARTAGHRRHQRGVRRRVEAGGLGHAVAQQSVETWRAALEVNLTTAFALTQAAAPLLAASRHGSVVNVASIYGIVGPDHRLYEGTAMGNPAAYAASKGGLVQLTRWLATTLSRRISASTPSRPAGSCVISRPRSSSAMPPGRRSAGWRPRTTSSAPSRGSRAISPRT